MEKKMKKIALVMMLSIIIIIINQPFVTVYGTKNYENHVISNNQLFADMFVKIKGINGESKISAGFILTITNLGDQIKRDIEWEFDTEGGTVIFGDGIRGTRPVLNPGEEANIIFKPGNFILNTGDGQSPIGLGGVTLMATAETSTDFAETTEDILLIGPIILFQ